MVQLSVLSGKMAGTSWAARHFPVQIGRSPSADLRADEDGVWDEHLSIEFSPTEGFLVQSHSEAIVSLNGEAVSRKALRNGDLIELGALKLQFWLGAALPGALGARELLVWLGIAAVSASQIALMWWLPK